jgi:hypothetical protein
MQDCLASLADVKASLYSKKQKSSFPQMPLEDMQIISAAFAGLMIIEGPGKLSNIFPFRFSTKKGRARVDPALSIKEL